MYILRRVHDSDCGQYNLMHDVSKAAVGLGVVPLIDKHIA